MRYLFDHDSNSLTITFAEGRQYRDSEEISDGVVVDFDVEGKPMAIEFLRANEFVNVQGLVSGTSMHIGESDAAESIPLTPASAK